MRTIGYKVSYEKMISRVPGLFAFIYVDGQGSTEIVKATTAKQCDYGQIIANINYQDDEFNYACEDGTVLKVSKGKHTYRTLIDTYYKAINDKDWDRNTDGTYEDEFLAFMEKGIGLKYVGLSEEDNGAEICGVKGKNTYPLAPDYIYLGEAKTLYDNMIKLKKQVEFYEKHKETCKDDAKYYAKLSEEYEMRNGDEQIRVLCEMIQEADETAEKYLGYATDGMSIDFSVSLYGTIKDLGMVTPYIEEWIPGKRYYEGDVVYHVDGNGYGLTWKCDFQGGGKLVFDNSTPAITDCDEDENGRRYTEGAYDENSELIFFEDGSTTESDVALPTNWVAQSLNWVDRNRSDENGNPLAYYRYAVNEEYSTKSATGQVESQSISGTCNSHLTGFRRYTTYTGKNDEAEYPEGFEDWLWYYRVGMVFNREEKYDELGNLTVMYGEHDYDNDRFHARGVEPIANDKGTIGGNIDFDGNIARNLAVWGDVITSIEAENNDDTETGTITFEYYMGAHLIAEKDGDSGDWYDVDDDGNHKYYFKDFSADVGTGQTKYGKDQGVKYTETYTYYKGDMTVEIIDGDGIDIDGDGMSKLEYGERYDYGDYSEILNENKDRWRFVEESIWSLVASGRFDDYVNGMFDYDYVPENVTTSNMNAPYYYMLYDKMEFDTSGSVRQYDFKIGSRYNQVQYLMTDFEATADITHVDFQNTPLTRHDYYNGVSFHPTVNDDVNIERGITQAFEKYIKFGEIKTLEDMENYANGGFFSISQENLDLGK